MLSAFGIFLTNDSALQTCVHSNQPSWLTEVIPRLLQLRALRLGFLLDGIHSPYIRCALQS